MTSLRTVLALLCLALAPLALAQVPGSTQAGAQTGAAVQLKVGGRQTLNVKNIIRVAVGDPEVADIRVAGGGDVEITGRAPGNTQLQVWRSDGTRLSYPIAVSR